MLLDADGPIKVPILGDSSNVLNDGVNRMSYNVMCYLFRHFDHSVYRGYQSHGK